MNESFIKIISQLKNKQTQHNQGYLSFKISAVPSKTGFTFLNSPHQIDNWIEQFHFTSEFFKLLKSLCINQHRFLHRQKVLGMIEFVRIRWFTCIGFGPSQIGSSHIAFTHNIARRTHDSQFSLFPT